MSLTHLDVKAELLEAFEERFLVAGNKCLHVGVDARTDLQRLLLYLQLDTEEEGGEEVGIVGYRGQSGRKMRGREKERGIKDEQR